MEYYMIYWYNLIFSKINCKLYNISISILQNILKIMKNMKYEAILPRYSTLIFKQKIDVWVNPSENAHFT